MTNVQSQRLWGQATYNVGLPLFLPKAMSARNSRCRLTIVYTPRAMWAIHTRWPMNDVHKIQRMQAVHDRCRLIKAHRPSFIVHVFGRRWCCFADSHTPWRMHARPCWCYLVLADVSCLMCTYFRWCCLTLMMQMSPNKFNKTITNVCRPWLMCLP